MRNLLIVYPLRVTAAFPFFVMLEYYLQDVLRQVIATRYYLYSQLGVSFHHFKFFFR